MVVNLLGLIPTGNNFLLNLFKVLDVKSGLKCKFGIIVKNSNHGGSNEVSKIEYSSGKKVQLFSAHS